MSSPAASDASSPPNSTPQASFSFRDLSFYTPTSFHDSNAPPRASSSPGPWTPSSTPSSRPASDNPRRVTSPTPTSRGQARPSVLESFEELSLSSSRSTTPFSTGASASSSQNSVVPASAPPTPPTSPPEGGSLTRATRPSSSAHSGPAASQAPESQSRPRAQPYDPRDEAAPEHEFFSQAFQARYRVGLSVAASMTTAIEKVMPHVSATDSSALQRHLNDARALRDFQPSDTRTVAVLGDSGEGKSSLINSLLHCPGIAETSDIGSACTSVVTEYRYRRNDQTARIAIEVEYLSRLEIASLIRELVWSYRQFYLALVETDATSPQDYERYRRESEQAWSALEAAFGHEDRFSKEMLRGALGRSGCDESDGVVQEEGERIARQLIDWTGDIEWPGSPEAGFWSATAASSVECSEKTELFMENRVWPFTKIIRIYLSAQVLKTGIVLADLPGLQDTNLARVQATQVYLMHCDHILIVAKISRAITDQSLRSSIYQIMAQHAPMEWEQSAGSIKVAVVCTKSDDIDVAAAIRKFYGPGKSLEGDPSMLAVKRELRAARMAGDTIAHAAALKEQQLLLMQARNNHVTEGLQRAYAAEVPGRHLPVFCVSNRLYERHTRRDGSTRYVRASQIPQLRHFCHSITADAQLAETKNLLESRLPRLLSSLSNWTAAFADREPAQRQTAVDNGAILRMMEDAPVKAGLVATPFRDAFEACFQENILSFIEHRGDNWADAALKEAAHWRDWHYTQYSAWCRNNGNYSTQKRGHVDWNAKIIWKMRTELEFAWDMVEDEIEPLFDQVCKETTTILNNLGAASTSTATTASRDLLESSITTNIADFKYKLGRAKQQFRHEIKYLRKCAMDSHSASFAVKELAPTYRTASTQSGTGMKAKQVNLVEGQLRSGALFPNMLFALSSAVIDLLETTQSTLAQISTETTNKVIEDVRMVVERGQTRVVKSAEDGRQRARVLALLQPKLVVFGRTLEDTIGRTVV